MPPVGVGVPTLRHPWTYYMGVLYTNLPPKKNVTYIEDWEPPGGGSDEGAGGKRFPDPYGVCSYINFI